MSYHSFRLDPNIVNSAILTPNLDNNIEDNVEDPPDIEKAVRIDLAHQAWKDVNEQLAIRKAARIFGISFSILNSCIHSAVSKAQVSEAMQ